MSNEKSLVWKYFSKLSKEKAECLNTNCSQIIQCSNGTTTAMMNHLKIHNISIRKINMSHETGTSYSKIKTCGNNILNFIKPETLNEILTKCATKKLLSFLAISKCEQWAPHKVCKNCEENL